MRGLIFAAIVTLCVFSLADSEAIAGRFGLFPRLGRQSAAAVTGQAWQYGQQQCQVVNGQLQCGPPAAAFVTPKASSAGPAPQAVYYVEPARSTATYVQPQPATVRPRFITRPARRLWFRTW